MCNRFSPNKYCTLSEKHLAMHDYTCAMYKQQAMLHIVLVHFVLVYMRHIQTNAIAPLLGT